MRAISDHQPTERFERKLLRREGGREGAIPIRNKIEEQEEPDAEAGRNGAQDGHKQKFE
jgi:hypothetical protein